MLDTHRDTDFLEDLWMDDCKCETEHKNLPCTVKVTGVATATCCNWWILKCENGIRYSQTFMSWRGVCSACGQLAMNCWTIRPI